MRFREALQVELSERYRRFFKSGWTTFESNLRYMLEWLDSVPALKSIIDAIERSNPDISPEEWWETVQTRRAIPDLPNEEARAKVVFHGLREIAHTPGVDFRKLFAALTLESNYDDAIRAFASQWFEPVVEYIQSRMGAESDILYALERYRRRLLWFRQLELFEAYESDTSRGEELYERDLREFLFDEGIDYPFSQPASPSGRADLVAGLDSDDPLACEVKLFNGTSYGIGYLAKGVSQAHRYANDYGKTAGYLVIYNLSDHNLELTSDDPDAGWPPRITVGGVTVFLIVVQAKPLAVASKTRKVKAVVVTREDLVELL